MNALKTYHVWSDNQSSGPFTVRQLRDMLKAAKINSGTLIAEMGTTDWLPVSSFPEVSNASAPARMKTPEAVPQVSGDGVICPQRVVMVLGAVCAALGLVCMLYFSFGYKITVGGGESSSYYQTKQPEVNNVGLMSNREAGMLFGGFLFVGGCVLAARKPD